MIRGRLESYWETGTEGVRWALEEDGKPGYDGLHALRDGDRLTVYADDEGNTVLWEGVVELEYKRLWRPYPMNPESGQQAIFGHWVHGFQAGLEPDVWARWFFEHRRAALVKKEAAQP